MEDLNNILDDLVDLDINESELKRLDSKYKNRTQTDIQEPFYQGSKFTVNLTQFLSIILGFGACLYFAEWFPDYYIPIFSLCIGFLVFIEWGKRATLNKIDEIRIINRSEGKSLKSKPYFYASIFFVLMSMGSGYIGSPHLIKELSKHGDLINIDSINFKFEDQIVGLLNDMKSQKTEAFALAAKLHNESSYEGVTSRRVRKQKADLIVLGAKKDSIATSEKSKLIKSREEAIIQANEVNQETIKQHKEFCYSFGWFFILVAIGLDVVLRILTRFNSNHEDRKRRELKKKLDLQGVKNGSKEVVKQLLKEKEEKVTNKEYFKDGEITPSNGGQTNVITIRLSDGSFKKYSSGKFRNLFNGSTIGRKLQLLHYLNDLNKYEGREIVEEEDLINQYKTQ
jgi:hypothetical protein